MLFFHYIKLFHNQHLVIKCYHIQTQHSLSPKYSFKCFSLLMDTKKFWQMVIGFEMLLLLIEHYIYDSSSVSFKFQSRNIYLDPFFIGFYYFIIDLIKQIYYTINYISLVFHWHTLRINSKKPSYVKVMSKKNNLQGNWFHPLWKFNVKYGYKYDKLHWAHTFLKLQKCFVFQK